MASLRCVATHGIVLSGTTAIRSHHGSLLRDGISGWVARTDNHIDVGLQRVLRFFRNAHIDGVANHGGSAWAMGRSAIHRH